MVSDQVVAGEARTIGLVDDVIFRCDAPGWGRGIRKSVDAEETLRLAAGIGWAIDQHRRAGREAVAGGITAADRLVAMRGILRRIVVLEANGAVAFFQGVADAESRREQHAHLAVQE